MIAHSASVRAKSKGLTCPSEYFLHAYTEFSVINLTANDDLNHSKKIATKSSLSHQENTPELLTQSIMFKSISLALAIASLGISASPIAAFAETAGNGCSGNGTICGHGNSIGGINSGNTSNSGNTVGSYNGSAVGSYNQDNRRYDSRRYNNAFNQNQRYSQRTNNQRWNNQRFDTRHSDNRRWSNRRNTNVHTNVKSDVGLF